MRASALLPRYLSQLSCAANAGPTLDLACGTGHNGLYLLEQGIPVVFADSNPVALEQIKLGLETESRQEVRHMATMWQVDFEQTATPPLSPNSFSAILVFRYLHRPLLPQIKQAICPGGLIIYETFTVEQARFGRPKNPDFLLRPGELENCFADWQVLHSFEGTTSNTDNSSTQAIAQIVAVKPSR